MGDPVTIYVTKDAAKSGVRELEAWIDEDGWARAKDRKGERSMYGDLFAPASFRTALPDAIADAERRRARRIASLEKQLAAVRAIDLTRPIAPTPEQTGGE